MKLKLNCIPCAGLLALGLAASASGALLPGATPAAAAENKPDGSSPFTDQMRSWEQKMSDVFHNTWDRIWQDKEAKGLSASTVATASVDLREQPDHYTLRLNLPGRKLDQVGVTMEGDTLHIVAPAAGKAGRYAQDIELSGVARDAQPAIERTPGKNLIVVTVPKTTAVTAAAPPAAIVDPVDRDVLAEMNRMQHEMDRVFDQDFAGVRNLPQGGNFFDSARFGSSFDLQDEGNKYVVRAYLPGSDMNNVKITANGRTLRIEAREAASTRNQKQGTTISSRDSYSQELTLPGPVQDSKMAVKRGADMVIVTLPKKQAA